MPKRANNRRLFGLIAGALVLGATTGAYLQKDQFTGQLADLSRAVLGDENTAQLEEWYFTAQDTLTRVRYEWFGAPETPFEPQAEVLAISSTGEYVAPPDIFDLLSSQQPDPAAPVEPAPAEPQKLEPMILPATRPIFARPVAGEGVWTLSGLPYVTQDDPWLAKTFVRPDPARPYSSVGVLLLDHRRIRLHVVGGTDHPGGDRGVRGPGVIPQNHLTTLLAAWNGGFQGQHGNYGMFADGKLYRPLVNGLASIAVSADGTIVMGEWGRTISWSDQFVAVRQNAVLLVEEYEITRRANEQGQNNNVWGYVNVNSSEFITWRSAIGLTENGDLLVAAGNSLSAKTLALAMKAAGARVAMQLDINTPYVLTSLFTGAAEGRLRASKFMDTMVDKDAARFLKRQTRDFMYVTIAE